MSPKVSATSVTWLLVAGLVFHLVYIGTVFDCYFTSPVVHGMQHYSTERPLSKRLVLIVGDGLRADLVFGVDAFDFIPGAPNVTAPYLRSIIETRGAYGVSHTRVPTESRPGHVALIAGMYEDVSAVTKGWKTNPVDFDSVFNQSSHTFSFGSPDILPMFQQGATHGRVKAWCYEEHEEDFSKDATALDTWVLDHLRQLLHNATTDAALDHELRSDKVIFFLHLLGLDTTGHAYRPHSKEYMNNIMVVDAIVRQTEALLTEFYGDEETSFVFTADHGMSRIGNHGDGDPDNTRTPLVVWGKGVRGPIHVPEDDLVEPDTYTAPFKLSHIVRQDVEQADVAALMATLVGINWPVNSVGVLPDVYPGKAGYLKLGNDGRAKAEAALVNAKVVLEHYRVKHDVKRKHTLFYKPFAALDSDINEELPGSKAISHIERLIRSEQFSSALHKSFDMIQTTLAGLRYLQTYDRSFIRSLVVIAYTGWAAYAATFILISSQAGSTPTVNAYAAVLALWIVLAIQRSPWSFYLYAIFPCYFWDAAVNRAREPFLQWAQTREKRDLKAAGLNVGRGVLVAAALGCMVKAYTVRSIWSIGFVLMGLVWPRLWPRARQSNTNLTWLWSLSCLATGVFPLLDVNKRENLLIILVGGLLMVLVANIAARYAVPARGAEATSLLGIVQVQSWLILATMMIAMSSVYRLQAKAGLPLLNQIAGWCVLVISTLYPAFSNIKYVNPESKLIVLFLAFCPCFVILSISNEGLFYLSYSVTLGLWIEVEAMLRPLPPTERTKGNISVKKSNDSAAERVQRYKPCADDLRIALFFLFFVQVGFFGTGNVASVSSFYLEPVYRLIPVFKPFLMAALLIFKIVAPYVILSATFATLNARLGLPPFSLFLVALTLTDGMTMTFFFLVTDTGSWLEIGQTISFFCITSLLLVWSAGICAAGEIIMGDVLDSLRSSKSNSKVD